MFSRSLALAGCAALCAIGQSNFATLRGTIQDSSTAAVHGANVTIRAKETGAVRTVRSNEHGLYEAVSLSNVSRNPRSPFRNIIDPISPQLIDPTIPKASK